jgi:hypothetical protein
MKHLAKAITHIFDTLIEAAVAISLLLLMTPFGWIALLFTFVYLGSR